MYNLAGIEVATNKLGVVRKLLESLDKDHVRLHERVAYCCNTVEYVLCYGGCRAGEGADEVYVRVWTLGAPVDAFETEDHCGALRMRDQSR